MSLADKVRGRFKSAWETIKGAWETIRNYRDVIQTNKETKAMPGKVRDQKAIKYAKEIIKDKYWIDITPSRLKDEQNMWILSKESKEYLKLKENY